MRPQSLPVELVTVAYVHSLPEKWLPISIAVSDADLEICVTDKFGIHAFVFPIRKNGTEWVFQPLSRLADWNASIDVNQKDQLDFDNPRKSSSQLIYRNVIVSGFNSSASLERHCLLNVHDFRGGNYERAGA
jgi:hypothetical protein